MKVVVVLRYISMVWLIDPGWIPKSYRGCTGTLSVVAPHFHCQNNVLRLLVLLRIVCSRMPKVWARAPRWRRAPASLRSELEMVPSGFEEVTTSLLTMNYGYCRCHTIGTLEKPVQGARVLDGNLSCRCHQKTCRSNQMKCLGDMLQHSRHNTKDML